MSIPVQELPFQKKQLDILREATLISLNLKTPKSDQNIYPGMLISNKYLKLAIFLTIAKGKEI